MIRYTIEKKVLPNDRSKAKYYPKIVRGETLDTDQVAALLQERTTLDNSEVFGFLNALGKAVRSYVVNSCVVEVEGLGIFTPTIKATAVDTEEELKADTIIKKGVNYRPTTAMTNGYKSIGFTKANLDLDSVINGYKNDSTPDSGDDNSGGSGGGTTPGGGNDLVG
ncbi:MAG: hypothetical protein IJ269_03510 [Bacteroidales bacterium]|nr:hypothetical protein [Bacteroidales bacterium]